MASGFIESSSYDTGHCPDCGHEVDWASDVTGSRPTYDVTSRVRIDITRESVLDYDYHGRHGIVVDHDPTVDEYLIELDESGERITARWKDLRSPLGTDRGERRSVASPI